MKTHTMQPNTTQVPHHIIREWMPRLKDVELRVLLVVVDQTLGWLEDEKTKRRKEYDWISSSQLVLKTGRSRKHISASLKVLIDEYHLIEATDGKGRKLDSAEKRQGKFGQIFYRLTLHEPAITLFDEAPRASKGRTTEDSETKRRTQKGRTTKETLLQKETTTPSATPERAEAPRKKPESDHAVVVRYFYEAVEGARGFKPVINGKDGAHLKRVLGLGISPDTIEQAATYFLYDPSFKTFTPSLSTLLSAGILNGLLNRMKNDPDFWRKLEGYLTRRNRSVKKLETREDRKAFIDDLAKLKRELAAKLGKSVISPAEAAELGVEQAKVERASA